MKQPVINQTVYDMAPSGIRRFFDIANEIPDIISLGVGEPDFETPWAIRAEAINCIKQGKTFYTANAGLLGLRQEVCRYLNRHYQLSYSPHSEVIITVGGSEAIDLACRTLINPGDEVICLDPSYVAYEPAIALAGGVAVSIALESQHNFVLQPDQLKEAITDKTKAIILNYPNNPTGAAMLKDELAALVPIIIENDLYVITDEIYSEIWYANEPYCSIASFPGMKERTIYINGFSKAFSMTGWRAGYLCASEELTQQMLKIHQYTILAAPTISQYAAIIALRDCEEEVETMRIAYQQRRNFLIKRFEKMGLSCFRPEGAFYAFPDIREFGMTSEAFALELLNKEKLAVVPGSAFGRAGEGFLRISYAYSIKELEEAMDKLDDFVQYLRARSI